MGNVFPALQTEGFPVGVLVGQLHHFRRLRAPVGILIQSDQRGVGLAAEGTDIFDQVQVQLLRLVVLVHHLVGGGHVQQTVVVVRIENVRHAVRSDGCFQIAAVGKLLRHFPVGLSRRAVPLLKQVFLFRRAGRVLGNGQLQLGFNF